MNFDQTFDLAVAADDAWGVIRDLELLVPCLPGASLDSSDGAEFTGKVTVKVGPIQVKYRGRGVVAACDGASRTMTIEAAGDEATGTGTVSATVSAHLEPVGSASCRMRVWASYEVTGTPARFGNGVMLEVAERILRKFTTNVAATVASLTDPTTAASQDAAAVQPPDTQLTMIDLIPASWIRVGSVATFFVVGLLIAVFSRRGARIGRGQQRSQPL